MNDFEITSALDPWSLFAYKIIERAVYDWRLLLQGVHPDTRVSMEEIRRFLKSGWCDELLEGFCVNGEWVLKQLEQERDSKEFGEEKMLKERNMSNRKSVTIDGKTASVYGWCKMLGIDNCAVYKIYNEQGRKACEQHLTGVKRRRGL